MLPNQVKLEDVRVLIDAVRGKAHWRSRPVIEAAYNIAGYGLNQLVLDEIAIGSAVHELLTDNEAELLLIDTESQLTVGNPEAIGGPVVTILVGLAARKLAEWALKKVLDQLIS